MTCTSTPRSSNTASLLAATGQSVAAGVWTPAVPRLGLFVAPGGGRAGEVESLVWEAWSNDAKHAGQRACIEGFLSCMEAESVQPKSVDKARVSALLAVLCDDDPRLGPGARAKLFDYARPEFGSLLAFLADL